MKRALRIALLAAGLLTLAAGDLQSQSAGKAGPDSQPDSPPGKRLKVLTFNINYGMPAREATLKTIRTADADIVCLQEVSADWERFLRPNLARLYPNMLFKPVASHPAAGQAVLSKFPFKLKAYAQPPGSWGPVLLVVAETPIGPVQLMNVHLCPPLTPRKEFTLEALNKATALHLPEIERAFERAQPKLDQPLIVLGDFNEGEDGLAMTWLKDSKIVDALFQFDKTSVTWQWKLDGFTPQARLDHITYLGLACVSARVHEAWSSDHRAVEAVFQKAPASQPDKPK